MFQLDQWFSHKNRTYSVKLKVRVAGTEWRQTGIFP